MKNKATETVHLGRAANCACRSMPGSRCPDCNHLLPSRNNNNTVECSVCHRLFADTPDTVVLEVQSATSKQKGAF